MSFCVCMCKTVEQEEVNVGEFTYIIFHEIEIPDSFTSFEEPQITPRENVNDFLFRQFPNECPSRFI